MSSVQTFTIYKAKRIQNSVSQFSKNLITTKNTKINKTPIANSKILPQKRLDFDLKKRQREESPMKNVKKSKLVEPVGWKLMICLFDEDLNFSINFKCFNENSIIPFDLRQLPEVKNLNDDDCRTQEKEIDISCQYLAFQLEESLKNEPCNV